MMDKDKIYSFISPGQSFGQTKCGQCGNFDEIQFRSTTDWDNTKFQRTAYGEGTERKLRIICNACNMVNEHITESHLPLN